MIPVGSFWCGLGIAGAGTGECAGSLVTLELHPEKGEAPDSREESWASGRWLAGLHRRDQRAVSGCSSRQQRGGGCWGAQGPGTALFGGDREELLLERRLAGQGRAPC